MSKSGNIAASAGLPRATTQSRISPERPPLRKILWPYWVSRLPLTITSVWHSKKETTFSPAGTFYPTDHPALALRKDPLQQRDRPFQLVQNLMGGDGLFQVRPHKPLELSNGLPGIALHFAGQGQQLPIRLESHLVLSGVDNLQTPFLGCPLMIRQGVPRRRVQGLAGLKQTGDHPDAVQQQGGNPY